MQKKIISHPICKGIRLCKLASSYFFSVVYTRASVTMQYNLVPANGVMLGGWGGNRGPGGK